MLMKLKTILLIPKIKLSLFFAEHGEQNLIFQFLIVVSNTFSSPTDKPNILEHQVKRLVKIVKVFEKVKKVKSVDEVDPANNLVLVEEHLHRKLI